MAIKDIFLPLVGEPSAAAIAAIEKCTAIAGDIKAVRSVDGVRYCGQVRRRSRRSKNALRSPGISAPGSPQWWLNRIFQSGRR